MVLNSFGSLWLHFRLFRLEKGVDDKEQSSGAKHDQEEDEVLGEERDEFGGAHFLLLDEQVECFTAFVAENLLVSDDSGRLAVRVHLFPFVAEARLDELR